jgi:hypothetical protein
MRNRSIFNVRMLGLAVWLAMLAQPAAGQSVTLSTGSDLFATPLGDSFVNLGTVAPAVSPSLVMLVGDPANLSTLVPNLTPADTDTIIQRTGPTQTIGLGGTATFSLQLAALDLVSTAPVTISGNQYNLRVLGGTLLGIPESTGSIAITLTDPGGGTFTSSLPITADVIFTPVHPGEPIIPTALVSDTLTPLVPGIWSTVGRTDDAHNSAFPAGGFFPAVDSEPGHPKVLTQEQGMLAQHGVLPAQSTPEPSTWIMYITAGLIVLPAYARWGRRARV